MGEVAQYLTSGRLACRLKHVFTFPKSDDEEGAETWLAAPEAIHGHETETVYGEGLQSHNFITRFICLCHNGVI